MSFIRFYILSSIALGIVEILDGVILITRGMTHFNVYISRIEAIWVIVSFLAIWVFKKEKLPIFIPITFILYNILGWAYGAYFVYTMVYSSYEPPSPPSPEFPLWVKLINCFFGIFFFVVNAKIWVSKMKRAKS